MTTSSRFIRLNKIQKTNEKTESYQIRLDENPQKDCMYFPLQKATAT
jgi:hypothetical protein